jgi:hypothetical protein
MRCKIADLPPMPPGYNIAPGAFQPVVHLSEETGERKMSLMGVGPGSVLVENAQDGLELCPR